MRFQSRLQTGDLPDQVLAGGALQIELTGQVIQMPGLCGMQGLESLIIPNQLDVLLPQGGILGQNRLMLVA